MEVIRDKIVAMLRFLWRFKYIVLVLILLVVSAGAWVIYQNQLNAKWSHAIDSYRRANYDEAAGHLKGLSIPDDPERLQVYAQTMLATQQLDKAAEGYTKLYNQNKDPFNKLLLGNVYNQQQKYDEADKVYNEIIKANPNFVQAYVNLSTMYKLQNDTDKALEVAKQGVKNNPDNVTLLELLVSMSLSDKESSTYKDAVERLRKVNPKDPLLESLNEVE